MALRRGLPGAEATLRRVVDDGIVLVSTGGGDFTRPRGEAVKVDGGYRVSGRKAFASQSPAGAVMSTMFVDDDPERGRRVLEHGRAVRRPGVTVHDNWDTLGMRGTGEQRRHDRRRVRPRRAVLADRPYGVLDPPLQVIASIAFSIIRRLPRHRRSAPATHADRRRVGKADDPSVQRQVGLMSHTACSVAGVGPRRGAGGRR